MNERGPGPRPEQLQRREKVDKKTETESSRSPNKRKLALAASLIAGVGVLYEKMSDPSHSTDSQTENSGHHQEISTEQQRNIEAARNKLRLAALVLSEIRPAAAIDSATENTTEDDTAKEEWFDVQTALQNARADMEKARTQRSRDGEYGSLQQRLSQHPEAEKMYDDNFKKVQLEYTEDGVYAHLDGKNGFDLVASVNSDLKTHEPVLDFSINDSLGPYNVPVYLGNYEERISNLDGMVQMQLEGNIEAAIIAATKRELKEKYPDYEEPPFEAPAAEDDEDTTE